MRGAIAATATTVAIGRPTEAPASADAVSPALESFVAAAPGNESGFWVGLGGDASAWVDFDSGRATWIAVGYGEDAQMFRVAGDDEGHEGPYFSLPVFEFVSTDD